MVLLLYYSLESVGAVEAVSWQGLYWVVYHCLPNVVCPRSILLNSEHQAWKQGWPTLKWYFHHRVPCPIWLFRALVLPKQLLYCNPGWVAISISEIRTGICNLFRALVIARLLLKKDTVGSLTYTKECRQMGCQFNVHPRDGTHID